MGRLPDKEKDDLVLRRLEEGDTLANIAKDLGVSRQAVSQRAKRVAGSGSIGLAVRREERRVRLQKLVDEGYNFTQIAEKEGLSVINGKTLKNLGVVVPKKVFRKDQCGNIQSYRNGCHCKECKKANLEHHNKYTGPGYNFTHGTETGYTNHRCRCPLCAIAGSEHNRRGRINRKKKGLTVSEGLINLYLTVW